MNLDLLREHDLPQKQLHYVFVLYVTVYRENHSHVTADGAELWMTCKKHKKYHIPIALDINYSYKLSITLPELPGSSYNNATRAVIW